MTELPHFGNKCPLCGRDLIKCDLNPGADDYTIECDRCGRYQAEARFIAVLPRLNVAEELPYVSADTRQTWEWNKKPALVLLSNWKQLAEAHRRTSISQKAEKLLRLLGHRSRFPGAPAPLDPDRDFPLIDAQNPAECGYYRLHLEGCGWIKTGQPVLTVEGWQQIDPSSGGAGIAGRVFVAMAFRDELNEVWTNGFDAGLRDCGLDPVRVDQVEHTGKICDRIIVEIRRAQFVVADFTLQRPNVYYEAGFAEALGREVVHCCREDQFPKVEQEGFDVRQYAFIVWRDSSDLRKQLADRVRGLGLARRL